MGWLSDLIRGPAPTPEAPTAPTPSQEHRDSWEGLVRATADLEDQVSAAADTLPPTVVVLVRRILDGVDDICRGGPDLPAEARIAVHAILTDYLPTTLRTYLDATRHTPSATADTRLREQVAFIRQALDRTRTALHENDVRAVEVQAQFLRTKYTESDLA